MAEQEGELRINTGVVKSFNDKKGFGFITPDDGSEELFVHYSSILSNGYRRLFVGETVEFAIYFGGDGLTKAVDVIVPNGIPGGGGGYWYDFGGDYGNRGGGRKTCFNCGEGGHTAMNCYQGGGGGRRGCFNCGEFGHFVRKCPKSNVAR